MFGQRLDGPVEGLGRRSRGRAPRRAAMWKDKTLMGWRNLTRSVFVAVAGVCLAGGAVRAADTAYINMETVFEGYYKTVRANAGFEQKKKDFEGRLEILRDELKSMVTEARKTEEEASSELLSQEAREEARTKLRLKSERLRAKEEEFGQFRRSGMGDLNRARLVAEEELIKDITEFVRTYCKGKGHRLVYDVTGRSLNRMPVLLLYPTDEEITPAVLAEINKGHEEELKQATTELEALRKAAADRAGKGSEGEADKGAGIKPAAEAAP